jgi:hypothetical protein
MLHRPSARRRKRTEAQARWRRNAREGRWPVPRVTIDADVLGWLERVYPNGADFDDLGSVGELISEILRISARV